MLENFNVDMVQFTVGSIEYGEWSKTKFQSIPQINTSDKIVELYSPYWLKKNESLKKDQINPVKDSSTSSINLGKDETINEPESKPSNNNSYPEVNLGKDVKNNNH